MRLWPFSKQEERQDSYTDRVVTVLVERATGEKVQAKTAAVEAAAGLWGRAFASARPTPEGILSLTLNPRVLYALGRDLCLTGRFVGEISVGSQGLMLERADEYRVTGLGPEEEWVYEVVFKRPSGTQTRTLAAGRVVDVRLGSGLSYSAPIAGASTSTGLLDNVEGKLVQETAVATGYLLPVPPGRKEELQSDIKQLKGRLGVVETTKGGWDGGPDNAPRQDFELKRLGAAPPESLIVLRENMQAAIFAATGVPHLATARDGAAQREQLRRFLHSTINPVADVALVELRYKLDTPDLALDFRRLFASDLASRARAFGQLVTGGMALEEAAKITGVLNDDSE